MPVLPRDWKETTGTPLHQLLAGVHGSCGGPGCEYVVWGDENLMRTLAHCDICGQTFVHDGHYSWVPISREFYIDYLRSTPERLLRLLSEVQGLREHLNR